jgi:site-specific recombinase
MINLIRLRIIFLSWLLNCFADNRFAFKETKKNLPFKGSVSILPALKKDHTRKFAKLFSSSPIKK